MQRSAKPKRLVQKVEERVLSQEELDYMRYVDPTGGEAALAQVVSMDSLK